MHIFDAVLDRQVKRLATSRLRRSWRALSVYRLLVALPRDPKTIERLPLHLLAALCCLGIAAGCTKARAASNTVEPTSSVRGGALEIVAYSDVDHLVTTSAYNAAALWLNQLTARQLLGFPPSSDNAVKVRPAPDIAREVPTRDNGGVSADGLTYTVHLKRGVRWNTNPPRDVTAGDVIRAIKLLCNPVMPGGSLLFYQTSIAGMDHFCAGFAKVPGTVAAIRRFVDSTSIDGARAPNDSTVVFQLATASSDFVNLLALPQASPIPDEYLNYLPDSPEFRQHTLATGPYQLVQYVQNRQMLFERNPAWDRETDQLHAANVDRVRVRVGIDAQLQLLQIQAGTADLGAETVRAADMGPLLASGDPTIWLSPTGDIRANFQFLAVNRISPDADRVLGRRDIRRAIALAIDKAALVQVNVGPRVARALRQPAASSVTGFVADRDFYKTPDDRGDPVAARRLLAQGGFDPRRVLRLAYALDGATPVMAQVLQASLERAGIEVELLPVALGDYYGRLLSDNANARRGAWDLAIVAWFPDWFGGNNGRAVYPSLFDGRNRGSGSPNYGGFEDAGVDAAIDRASSAATDELASQDWAEVSRLLMEEVAEIPLIEQKTAYAKSRRVRGCSWSALGMNCDLTAVWLSDARPTVATTRRTP
jgi:ABC-type transport system substrate-binding protein